MNYGKGTYDPANFVALQASDEVPLQRKIDQLLLFGQGLCKRLSPRPAAERRNLRITVGDDLC